MFEGWLQVSTRACSKSQFSRQVERVTLMCFFLFCEMLLAASYGKSSANTGTAGG